MNRSLVKTFIVPGSAVARAVCASAALCLSAAAALAQSTNQIVFDLRTLIGGPATNRTVLITPMVAPTAVGPAIQIGDAVRFNSGSGTFVATNMNPGLYRVEVQPPPRLTWFAIELTNVTGWATGSWFIVESPVPETTYPRSVIDSRFDALGSIITNYPVATNATTASNNWVLSLTGNAVAWQPIHTTNFYGSIAQITNQTLIGSTNWATPLITLTQNWVGIGGPAFPNGASVQISAHDLGVAFHDTLRGRLYVAPATTAAQDYNANQSRWMLRSEFGQNTVLGIYCPTDNGIIYLTGGSGEATRPIVSIGDAPPVTSGGPGSVYLSGNTVRIRQSRVISSNTAASYPGEMAWDTNRVWVATGTNQWRHLNLSDYSTNFSVIVAKTNTGSPSWDQTILVTVPGGALSVGLVFEWLAGSTENPNWFYANVHTYYGSSDDGSGTIFIPLFDGFDGSLGVFRSPVLAFAAFPTDTMMIALNGSIAAPGDFVYGRLHIFIRRP